MKKRKGKRGGEKKNLVFWISFAHPYFITITHNSNSNSNSTTHTSQKNASPRTGSVAPCTPRPQPVSYFPSNHNNILLFLCLILSKDWIFAATRQLFLSAAAAIHSPPLISLFPQVILLMYLLYSFISSFRNTVL